VDAIATPVATTTASAATLPNAEAAGDEADCLLVGRVRAPLE
jgi:hypothetical protein